MIKFYALLTRRSDLTHEQFSEHWRTVHRELAVKIRRTRRYAQSHGIEAGLAGLKPGAWDGVAEVWLDDLAAASRSDPDLERYAKPDEPNFLASDGIQQLSTEHRLLIPPPEGGVKALVFAHRRDSSSELSQRWWEVAATLFRVCDDLSGVAAAVALPEAEGGPYDCVLELWWPEIEMLRADWNRNGRSALELLDDIIDVRKAIGWLCEELRITWPDEIGHTTGLEG